MDLPFRIFNKRKYDIGIALSGGGVRGLAHLGVLKALEKYNIYPDIIAGTSAGALVGVFYADGYSPDEIFHIFHKNSLFHFAKIALPRKGFFSIDKVSQILYKHIKAKNFEGLRIPLYVASTNLNDGEIVYFHTGELIKKIIASSSIPMLFKPVEIDGKTYVDGGVFDNLPIEPLLNKCKKIIASHVNPTGKEGKLDNILRITERTFHLAIGAKIREKAKECDLFIEPKKLKGYGLLNFDKSKEIFDIGYEAAIELLEGNKIF